MYIYKITNKLNNKIYIGQVYNKTIIDRFNRHIKDASSQSRSYIDRSIYKYGHDNFVCELIDTATSLQELNEKEKYWIKYYNSTNRNIGYNLTPGGDGGNTYLCKTEKEMLEIKHKISIANSGSKNGMSKQIKALNVRTNEIIHFDTLYEACKYFNHKQKGSFLIHCDHKAKNLWRKEWTFAYENDDFYYKHLNVEYDKSCNKGTTVKLINLDDNSEQIFNSLNKLNKYLNIRKGYLKYNNGISYYQNYKIIKLKIK